MSEGSRRAGGHERHGAGSVASPFPAGFAALSAALLLGLSFLAYGASLRYGFVGDDAHLISDRLVSYGGSFPLREAFTTGFWKGGAYGAAPGEQKDYYRPLVTLSYAAGARLWRGSPWGFHLVNLLLHVLASWLVLGVLLRLGTVKWAALSGALLFALHPIHVANVAWISGRTDLLCAVFLLAAYDRLAGSVDRRIGPGRRGPSRSALLLGGFAYLLALLSKEMAVILPGLLVLHILFRRAQARGDAANGSRPRPSGHPESRPPILPVAWPRAELLFTIGLTLAYVVFRAAVLGLPDLSAGARSPDVPFRPGVLPAVLTWYWRAFLLPGPLQLEVPFRSVLSAVDPRFLAGSALLIAQLAATVLLLRRGQAAGIGLGWILLALVPVAQIVPLVFHALVAEYWSYIPSIGFVLVLASGVPKLLERVRVPARAAAALLCMPALAGLFYIPHRSGPLASEETLLLDQVKRDPERVEAWVSLATEYGSRGEIDRAFTAIHEAVRRGPRTRGVQLCLGNLYDLCGLPDSAEAAYRREIRRFPASGEARVNLADMRMRAGDEAEATELYLQAMVEDGFPAPDVMGRARMLESGGQTRAAVPLWRALLRGKWITPEDLNHLAVAAMRGAQGRPASTEDARLILEMLLREIPDQPLALLNLGGIAYGARDEAECRSRWGRFLALYPDRPEAQTVREKLAALGSE